MAFAQEIYAEIISNITDKKSLFSLLLTSRMLNHEAERILYRELELYPPHPSEKSSHLHYEKVLQHISTCDRVANHVRSIEIQVEDKSASQVLCVVRALNALKNLKFLGLFRTRNELPLSSLVSGVPFQLSKFLTNFPIDHQLKSFLQSQPQITYLGTTYYGIDPDSSDPIILSRTDLPALVSLHFTDVSINFNHDCIQTHFPELFIANLCLLTSKEITIPLPGVQALQTDRLNHVKSLLLIFPNLRFLDTRHMYFGHDIPSCLQKLKLWWIGRDPPMNHVVDSLLRVYASRQSLKCVELCHRHLDKEKVTVWRIQERFNSHSMVHEPLSETSIENYLDHVSEWANWQG